MKLIKFLTSSSFNKILLIYSVLIFFGTLTGYIFKLFPHNTVANIMPGIAPHLDIGKPYVDYWDVYPPGIYLFYYVFFLIGRDIFLSYSILHFLILFGTIYFGFKIYQYISNQYLIFVIGLSYFLSPLYMHYLLPNELIGLFFSFLGLYIYLKNTESTINIIAGNFFLIYSAFIKEIFAASAFCIILYQIFTKDYRNLRFSIFGILFQFFLIYTYIFNLSIVDDVIKSYEYKYSLFNIEELLKTNYLYLVIAIFLFFIFKFLQYKQIIHQIKFDIKKSYVIYLYSIFMILSFLILNRDDGGHFDIPKIFPIFFLLSVLLLVKNQKLYLISSILIILISGYVLKFQHATYSYLLIQPQFNYVEKSYIHYIDTEISSSIEESNSSFLYLYGWGSTNYYYELKIKPYSKYWIINPQILVNEQIIELKNDISSRPPRIIYYCGFDEGCPAGFDFKKFENDFIDFKKLIEACYIDINNDYYELTEPNCVNDINF